MPRRIADRPIPGRLRPDRRALFEAALDDARRGVPRVVCLVGAAGTGKTTHLREVVAEAADATVLRAAGVEATYRPPFGVLEELGVRRTVTDDGQPQSRAVAAQALRRLIDDESGDGPVVIAVDDAQWADAESLAALRLVVEGLSHDRLLVVMATRPPGPDDPSSWHRFLAEPAVSIVELDGIELDEAIALAGEVRDERVPEELVERLWRHTGRNPMYLRSLLAEYSPEELAARSVLPAPVEFARELNARLRVMDPDAATLLRAVAVIGSSWVDRLDAAAVAEVDDAASAVGLLLDSGLLIARAQVGLADVRIVHALVRAAIYDSTPADERRRRHLLAAKLLGSPMQRLEHEVAAAGTRDEALAARLEHAATGASAERDHHREAQLLQWASQLSPDAAERERRWLRAQIARVHTRDTASVRAHLSQIGWSGEPALRTLVMAWLLVVENRIADARRVIEALPVPLLEGADHQTRMGLLVIKAWTMLTSGYPIDDIRAVIASIPPEAHTDPVLGGLYQRTAGQIASRDFDFARLRSDFDSVPGDPRLTPMKDTGRLGWRGSVYALRGLSAEGRRDLAEVVSRVRGGRIDETVGVSHALYAFALWQGGEFERAGIELQVSASLAVDRMSPLAQAVLPLVPTVHGEFARADDLLAQTASLLLDLPWHIAVSVLTQAEIVRLHAGDDEAARRGYLARLRARFGDDVTDADNGDGAFWHLHVMLARVWAGELDGIAPHLSASDTEMVVPDWRYWTRPWVTGLASERAGNDDDALRSLTDAVAIQSSELPLYRAHLYADLARIAARVGQVETSEGAARQAREIYARLGATAYLARVATSDANGMPADPLATLSDREREVAALVLAGFSYRQVAEELYVTRSTVAFHLGNIYAKTGVESRHQLTRLVRDATLT
ncbi:AAA family ATPase [Microbacterium sp.]|uniref:AAA family ATPase n=1 Tax=Microbacterium sp. TaxID=51671 RepID=UPI003C76BFAE